MVKEILKTTLLQGKYRDIFLNIWAWIYSQTNEHGVYYGTMKEICESCQTDYSKVNKAFEIQKQWNRQEFEKTVVLRQEKNEFIPTNNYHHAKKYFTTFPIDLSLLRSLYKPIIIVFNDKPYVDLPVIHLKEPKVVGIMETDSISETVTEIHNHLNGNGHHQPGKKQKPKKPKKHPDVTKELQDACLDVYIDFYEGFTGIKPMINGKDSGLQIKSLIEMIRYFRENNTDKSDFGIINSFDYIFQNWALFDDFHQKQLKLNQICSNLPNLIGIIKGAGQKVVKSKSAKLEEYSVIFKKVLATGVLDERINNLGKPKFTH